MSDFKLYWPVDSRRVNQPFGVNPEFYRPFGLAGHEGLDLFAPMNANIYAAADGEVYQAGHPPNHPYGLHIRIIHRAGGRVYRTIYAHLNKLSVQVGQQVKAGQLIGLANNSGNSFGSHLHFSLKIDGASTPGYPEGYVDPTPYMTTERPPATDVTPQLQPSDLTVYTTVSLNLRADRTTSSAVRAVLPAGEPVGVLGDANAARATLGQSGQWLNVQTANGITGFVAANFVEVRGETADATPSDIVVYPNSSLNVRSSPGTGGNILGKVDVSDALTVIGNSAEVAAKIGQPNQWLQIQAPNGLKGFVAAGFVHLTGQIAPPTNLIIMPTTILNIRARPSSTSQRIAVVTPADALTVLGDADEARQHIGQPNQWINIRTRSGLSGYAAAQFVGLESTVSATAMSGMLTLVVEVTADGQLRAQASHNSPEVILLARGTSLTVLAEDMNEARAKLTEVNNWLYLQTDAGERGWANTDHLSDSSFDD